MIKGKRPQGAMTRDDLKKIIAASGLGTPEFLRRLGVGRNCLDLGRNRCGVVPLERQMAALAVLRGLTWPLPDAEWQMSRRALPRPRGVSPAGPPTGNVAPRRCRCGATAAHTQRSERP